jgi:hypothetical protein
MAETYRRVKVKSLVLHALDDGMEVVWLVGLVVDLVHFACWCLLAKKVLDKTGNYSAGFVGLTAMYRWL